MAIKGGKTKFLVLGLIVWFVVHVFFMLHQNRVQNDIRQDCIVIFGNTVHPNGQLSDRLQARLDKGVDVYHNHHSKMLVSGGLGSEGHFEAEVMRDYLVSKGVYAEEIIVDNLGVNTRATVINAAKYLSKSEYLVLVSQYHHGLRAKLAFRQEGFEHIEFRSADFKEKRDIFSIIREFVGYYAYLLHIK